MAVSNADLASLIFLDCIEMGLGVPDGCDIDAMTSQDLVQRVAGGWALTPRGVLQLRELKSCMRRSEAGA